MVHKMINRVAGFGKNRLRNILFSGAASAGVASVPTAALARHPDFHVNVVVSTPPVCVEPIGHAQRRWIEPVYQTVIERVWVPAVTQVEMQRVIVPAEYEWRDVVSRDFLGRLRHQREQVQTCPARAEDRQVDVVLCPGHYEDQPHEQIICVGHWADVEPVAVVRPGIHIALPLPFLVA